MNISSSRSLNSLFLSTLLFVVASSSHLQAQDLDNITISGRIQDQNGDPVSRSTITIVFKETGALRSTLTDMDGRYRLIQLRPGKYYVRVAAAGFSSQEKSDIATIAAQNLQMHFTLSPQSVIVAPIIIDTRQTQAVDTSRTVVGGTITTTELNSLPIYSRSPLDLIFTLPGVADAPLSTRDLAEDRNANPANTPEEAGTFSLSGAPAYSNNLTIDGLDNNDDRAASERFQPSVEAIEEVQVITNQFSAEYGRASGGRVNIRTNSGSTTFRGRSFYYFRDEALNANTFRNNSLSLSRLPFQEHVVGFVLSGPIRIPKLSKNTFFFVAYEHDRVLDTALINTLVPVEPQPVFPLPAPTALNARRLEEAHAPAVAAEIAPFISSISTPFRNSISSIKIDREFTATSHGSFVYQRGRLSNMRQFGGGNRLAEALQAKTRDSDALSYSYSRVLSSVFVNQLRAQYSRLSPAFKSRDAQPVVLITINNPLSSTDPSEPSGTLVAGSSTSGATDRTERRFQLQEILAFARGTHALKIGIDFQRVRSTFIDLSDVSGTYNFASAGDFLGSSPSRYRQNFQTASTQRNTYISVFVQHEWRLRTNLLLSYGLRYENETILRDLNNIGPRFSLAFDPFNSGKTVVRFGAGIFYNRVLLRTIDDFTLGAKRLFFDTNALRDSNGVLLNPEQRRAFIAAQLVFPHKLQADSPLVQQFGVLNNSFSRQLDPSLRISGSYQANFGLERDLGRGVTLEANFTLNRGLHLWREFNANAPVLPPGYRDFTEYLLSRDFANFRRSESGIRPLYNAASAGELIRFVLNASNSVGNTVEFGVPVSLVNLNSSTSSTAGEIALSALNHLRPDPGRAEVEQLISAGNSFYDGLTIELRRRFSVNDRFNLLFRSAYTFSHLTDDGVVNTSDALRPGDFRAERARSLLDRRHRFVLSGMFDLPNFLARLRLAPIIRVASGAPFNISLGGADRNLDDVGNDRPNYNGSTRLLRWRHPSDNSEPLAAQLFALPAIGQSGNLPRNAGHGPGQFIFDLNVTRDFQLSNRVKLSPQIEFDNLLNKTVFSFGSEFINFTALSATASEQQRQAFLESFLVATRTQRHRQIRIGLRVDF